MSVFYESKITKGIVGESRYKMHQFLAVFLGQQEEIEASTHQVTCQVTDTTNFGLLLWYWVAWFIRGKKICGKSTKPFLAVLLLFVWYYFQGLITFSNLFFCTSLFVFNLNSCFKGGSIKSKVFFYIRWNEIEK